jgi:acetyl-CoA C-acetyltransferase
MLAEGRDRRQIPGVVPVPDLAAPLIRTVLDDVAAHVGTGEVAEVVLGNCMGPGGNVPASPRSRPACPCTFLPSPWTGSAAADWRLSCTLAPCSPRLRGSSSPAAASRPPPPLALLAAASRSCADSVSACAAAKGDPEMGQAADRLAAAAGVSRPE